MATESQIVLFITWFLALLSLIWGLYLIALNLRLLATRYIAIFFLIFAAHLYATGGLITADNLIQANPFLLIQAATTLALPPLLLLSTASIFKPKLVSGRYIWVSIFLILFAATPALLTLADLALNTSLWFTGIEASQYSSGWQRISQFCAGSLSNLLIPSFLSGFRFLTILFLLYTALLDKNAQRQFRILIWLLIVISLFGETGLQEITVLASPIAGILASSLSISILTFLLFRQAFAEHAVMGGKLQQRLTALILVTSLPLMAAMALFLNDQAKGQMQKDAEASLEYFNTALSINIENWLNFNQRALLSLSHDPDIISMDPVLQKPLLQAMAMNYPFMYLVSTTDLKGLNVARSDDADPKDYSDRLWYRRAVQGAPITYQLVKGRTSGQPALVVSVPIKDEAGTILGVAMFASDLDEITQQVHSTQIGNLGYSYIVDDKNNVVAHPNPILTAELTDLSTYPPVAALRQGNVGFFNFIDENGIPWRSYINLLGNKWGVIIQQPESELLASLGDFQRLAWIVMAVGSLVMIAMAWFTIRQSIRPILTLNDTATAIIQGDLDRLAPVESEDELGALSNTFNKMTAQLRQSITTLEERVSQRTQALERRALQLKATSEVARDAASFKNLDTLLNRISHIISERFGYYHVGIFLLSEAGKAESEASDSRPVAGGYAVLRAANSEGGQRMLARGHKLRVGQVGIVGYVAGSGKPRIALDVGEDRIFFNNPDLPMTRSEMALPLKIEDQIIGVLDIQSTQSQAFIQEDIEILQILADQISLAIENNQLLEEGQEAFHQLESLLGRQTRQQWQNLLSRQNLGFVLDPAGIKPLSSANGITPGEYPTLKTDLSKNVYTTNVPIEIRGEPLGTLILQRPVEEGPWQSLELDLIRETVSQVALALDNARLLEEIQNRASQEELINQIVAKTQASLNLENVMRSAVQEISHAMNLTKIRIRLSGEP